MNYKLRDVCDENGFSEEEKKEILRSWKESQLEEGNTEFSSMKEAIASL